ncbi:MAG: glutamate--tRNA ligase [Candidatus Bathyarchaeia archaeon]
MNKIREDAELREIIRKFALLNAIKHDGKAQTGPVVGKVLAEKPELRARAKELTAIVKEVVDEINSFPLSEQMRIVEEKWPETLVKERVEEEKRLPPLPNADKYEKIVTRFSPNPDCVLHLGSARAIVLCHEYARMYNGKFILRFEDTDPKLKRPVLEFYDRIREDLEWLGCKPDEEYIQSDRVPIYYEYAEKLLGDGNAYVCTCQPQAFREKVLAQKPCPCRNLPSEEHLERWNMMLEGKYKEGEAVVRIKTDLAHPNPAVRDWPALRVIDIEKYPHPRVGTKYRVWPLYNFACGLDDHLMDVTHIIRGKEHLTNMVRQEYMYKHLGWQYPEAIHYGRLKIKGAHLSKSKIVQGIRERLYKGWDDPRLATFAALRRRGITPEAIKKLIIDVGPKTSDVVLSWENLYAYNRKMLDPNVNRYFFVPNPIQLLVKNIPRTFTVGLRLHPEYPERGFKEYTIKPSEPNGEALFWISRMDLKVLSSGKIVRLMELFNIKIERVEAYCVEASFASESYEEAKRAEAPLIHWVPMGMDMPCQVVMPDATVAEGIAEKACKDLKPNDIVQFERFGFVRIDKVNAKITAYYAHK